MKLLETASYFVMNRSRIFKELEMKSIVFSIGFLAVWSSIGAGLSQACSSDFGAGLLPAMSKRGEIIGKIKSAEPISVISSSGEKKTALKISLTDLIRGNATQAPVLLLSLDNCSLALEDVEVGQYIVLNQLRDPDFPAAVDGSALYYSSFYYFESYDSKNMTPEVIKRIRTYFAAQTSAKQVQWALKHTSYPNGYILRSVMYILRANDQLAPSVYFEALRKVFNASEGYLEKSMALQMMESLFDQPISKRVGAYFMKIARDEKLDPRLKEEAQRIFCRFQSGEICK